MDIRFFPAAPSQKKNRIVCNVADNKRSDYERERRVKTMERNWLERDGSYALLGVKKRDGRRAMIIKSRKTAGDSER